MITLAGQSPILHCVSTDEKPETAPVNQIIRELDTGKYFYFTGETWAEIGGGGDA